jgi:hypothetical protein
MARLTDHDIRDAEDAARAEIGLVVKRYIRRMAEMSKAYIQEGIETATKEGRDVNGTAIGRAAAARAAADYFGGLAGAPQPALEGVAYRPDVNTGSIRPRL